MSINFATLGSDGCNNRNRGWFNLSDWNAF